MADDNVYLSPQVIAERALMLLENKLVASNCVFMEYKDEFANKGKKIGDTVKVEMPVHMLSGEGEDVSATMSRIVERSAELKVDRFRHVAWKYSIKDMTLTIDNYSKKHLDPAMAELANIFDESILGRYKEFYNAAGDCAVPSSYDDLATPATILTELAVPAEDRHLILSPAAKQSVTGNITALYMEALAKAAYQKGDLPRDVAGMIPYESQNLWRHTSETQTSVTVNTTLTKDSDTTDTYGVNKIKLDGLDGNLVEGDLFTIAGVYSVNPRNRRSTGRLQSFVVKSDKTVTGTADEITFGPAIIMSDGDYPQYQNVSAYPASGSTVTFKASHVANLAFHRNAIACAVIPIDLPMGNEFAARASSKASGLSVRVWRGSDIVTNENIVRCDIMWGVKALYPELGCRLCG